jgi:MHS family proline/betaine transporter-like MFS transporter
MKESPLFAKAKSEGKTSKNPLIESFGRKANLKIVLLALFGATAGQGVVWYTGQFYANAFIQKTMFVSDEQRIPLMLIAIVLATPFFIFFGRLSDKIGRKWIMMFGILIAVLSYRPIYATMLSLSDVTNKQEIVDKTSISTKVALPANAKDSIETTVTIKEFSDGTLSKETIEIAKTASAKAKVKKEINLSSGAWYLLLFLVFIQIFYVTMVYGPIAAFLVELFPTRIRYTSMSLPYHVGNGIFGGLTPFIATALAASGALNGLWYPIIIGAFTFIVGAVFLSNKITKDEVD